MWLLLLSASIHLGLLALLHVGWVRNRRREEALPPLDKAVLPPLSVLIAARNEAKNLERYLPLVCSQSYPRFDVLVVLNHTEDDSVAVLQKLQAEYPHLRWLDVGEPPQDWAAKKWAIQQGAEAAQYPHLALIDADCAPESGWLMGIGQHVAKGKEWVLGLGLYQHHPGWLNRFIRYETLYTAFQYIGASALGHPYMAVGRNLGYHRRFLLQNGGLAPWRASLSGDDDLLVGAKAVADKTAGMTKAGTRTWTEPPLTWRAWVRQKTRHVSASSRYSLITKALLGIFHLSHVGIYIGLGLILWREPTIFTGIGFYILVLLLKGRLLYRPAKDNGEQGLLISLLGLDLSYFLYNLSVVPLGLIKRPEWTNKTPESQKIPKKTES